MSVFDCYSKACSNGIQHHPTLLDATCWPRLNTMLEDVGLSLNLLKMLSMLALFEQAFKRCMQCPFAYLFLSPSLASNYKLKILYQILTLII